MKFFFTKHNLQTKGMTSFFPKKKGERHGVVPAIHVMSTPVTQFHKIEVSSWRVEADDEVS